MEEEYKAINKLDGNTAERRRLFIVKYGIDNYRLIEQNKILIRLKRDKLDREKELGKYNTFSDIVLPNMLESVIKQTLVLEIQALKEHIDSMQLLITYIGNESLRKNKNLTK